MEFRKTCLLKESWEKNRWNSRAARLNILRLECIISNNPTPAPYRKRDYYNISLLTGNCFEHHADKIGEIKKQLLIFTNPLVPYGWERN
jgi:hypothetical protein